MSTETDKESDTDMDMVTDTGGWGEAWTYMFEDTVPVVLPSATLVYVEILVLSIPQCL